MAKQVPPFSTEQRDEIARRIKVIFSGISPHTEATINSPCVRRIDHVEVLLRFEEGQPGVELDRYEGGKLRAISWGQVIGRS